MDETLARTIVSATAIATVYALVGGVALGAAFRLPKHGRAPTLLLAWAMLQHAVNELASRDVPGFLGFDRSLTTWISVITGYYIAVPWALLLERMVGSGWRSSIRFTAIAFVAFATLFTLIDLVRGMPGTAAAWSRTVVAAGAGVAFGNLYVMKGSDRAPLRVVRLGILVFMALVIQDALVRAGMLPWRVESGPWAVLICVAAIGYTVVTETLRRRGELRAIEHELSTARRIQASLLPEAAPHLDGATLVFHYAPAAAVAGDVFDFLPSGPHRVGILVADVSGHGVPAALIASMVKVAAAAQKPHADDPARVLAGIHLTLADGLPRAHFVTACYVYADLERHIVRHASAGHPPALVWRAATRTFAPAAETGPLIIGFAPAVYPVTEYSLAPGDRIVIYTDGIVEAMRPDGEFFGIERLREIVASPTGGASDIATAAIDGAIAFRGTRAIGLEDDCTLIVLEIDR